MNRQASIEIIPSILTDSTEKLGQMLDLAKGEVKRVHVDILDGVYADNKTIDPSALNDLDHSLLLDFHLMVDEPVNWVEKCVRAGADRIIAQIEMLSNQEEFFKKVAEAGVSPGLAIDTGTDVSEINDALLGSLEVVVVMSVPAGFGGQKFHLEALEKIHVLNEIRKEKGYAYDICDDGGITFEYIDDVRREGANQAVIGNRIFKGDLATNIAEYQSRA